MKNDYMLFDKSKLKTIDISNVNMPLPDLKNAYESKSNVIAQWLMSWIENDLKAGKINSSDLLPKKNEFAYLLGVSVGTIQNAFRFIEDNGFVESKQCIGTMISDKSKSVQSVRKLTSKRDIAVNSVLKYIENKKIKIGHTLPSTRVLADIIDSSANTTRLALEKLTSEGVLEHVYKCSNDAGWVVKSKDFKAQEFENETLVDKVEDDLKNYITTNLKVGDKIPSHSELSKELKVSVKTIHDALKTLIDDGILLARRGRYGTSVVRMPNDTSLAQCRETSIFASAQETAFYHYEKTQNRIKEIITENYEIGSKLPSILELSKEMDLSPNTIRKAFNNLAKEGYLRFSRGRYGGTFVIDIPESTTEQSFKWLAVNPRYAEVYR